MNQCLSCSKQCTETSALCDECRSSLLHQFPQKDVASQPLTLLSQAESANVVDQVQVIRPHLPKNTNPLRIAGQGTQPIIVQNQKSSTARYPTSYRYIENIPRHTRIALIALAIVLVLALLIDSMFLLKNLTHRTTSQNLDGLYTSPMMTGTPGAVPRVTVLATSTSSSQSSTAVVQGTPSATSPGVGVPILNVSPLHLDFSTTSGQANPPGQFVGIANTGGNDLNWQVNFNPPASWLHLSALQGTVAAGQTGEVRVNTNSDGLAAGTYSTQVSVSATDSTGIQTQGSPGVVSVTFTVFQPCSLQVTPSSLSFTATPVQPNPPGQSVTLTETGHCARPVAWTATSTSPWITLSNSSGSDNGSGSSIVVRVSANGMLPGHYTGQITISATANGGATVQGSPQTVSVTFNVV